MWNMKVISIGRQEGPECVSDSPCSCVWVISPHLTDTGISLKSKKGSLFLIFPFVAFVPYPK